MPATDTHRAIHAVFRIESARLIAGVARMVRDVGLAEELAQDALVTALEKWPASGIPDNPGAWLMATAKRRAIDELRRSKRLERKHEQLGHEIETRAEMSAPDASRTLDLLAALSHQTRFSIGCYCENEQRCHRATLKALLAERGADIR